VAALGSFLDARHHGGRWLVRMEDLDRERLVAGCADDIVRTLAAFGLEWDGDIEYQSARGAHYAQALAALSARALTFACSCSRREQPLQGGYPGTCRDGARRSGATATRFRVDDSTLHFLDRVQGECAYSLQERGDVIVRRRDGAYAYQLAVVVDDALQGVTDVVRGADLLDSTPWQIALQQALALPTPRYLHLPLVVEPDGGKLAKSKRSVALENSAVPQQLLTALTLLKQEPPADLRHANVRDILHWGVAHWQPQRLAGTRQVAAPLAQGS
jgi:glutamyl-Q tRNA(Asp) synthetase